MKTYNILFLCTHNSARSILGEAVASTQTSGKFIGYSAGSNPTSSINPIARELALEMGYPEEKLRSKSWNEFTLPNAPRMDFIITVCNSAAGAACPLWAANPLTDHWDFPDPSQVEGTEEEKRRAFIDIMAGLKERIAALAAQPFELLDEMSLKNKLGGLYKI